MSRLALIALALVVFLTPTAGLAWPQVEAEVLRGAGFLANNQSPDGSFFGMPADGTAEGLLAMGTVGSFDEARLKALEFLRKEGPARARVQAAYAGRISLGLVAGGQDPRSFHGTDYAGIITSFYDPATGAYDTSSLYADALAVLGLAASQTTIPANAVDYLKINQCADGGFSFRLGCGEVPDTDTTAVVLMALKAAGLPSSDLGIARARSFLSRTQTPIGGFKLRPYVITDEPNANSTGLALSAIAALNEDPTSSDWMKDGNDAVSALRRFQLPSGAFKLYEKDSRPNSYATVQAIPGLAGSSYPLRRVASSPVSQAGAVSRIDPGPSNPLEKSDKDALGSQVPGEGLAAPSVPAPEVRRLPSLSILQPKQGEDPKILPFLALACAMGGLLVVYRILISGSNATLRQRRK